MSNKPTIFFSHSSEDKDLLARVKDLFVAKTGGSTSVFLSSDGQSIKLGHNWVHSIEKALKAARIMVVFVTQNSMNSSWIFFESGHAYAKGISVVPVGIGGADISKMPPPLGLLQGFNVRSHEGLNNLLTLVNEEFGHQHSNLFTEDEYEELIRFFPSAEEGVTPFGRHTESVSEIVISAMFKEEERFPHRDDATERFSKHSKRLRSAVVSYFQDRDIEYTAGSNVGTYGLFVDIENAGQHEIPGEGQSAFRHHCRLLCRIDPHLADDNIPLAKDMLKTLGCSQDWFKVDVVLHDGVSFTREAHTVSARLHRVGVGLSGEGSLGTHRWREATFSIGHSLETGVLSIFCSIDDLSVMILHEILGKLFQTGVFRGNADQTSK